jgi:hypothetical protein
VSHAPAKEGRATSGYEQHERLGDLLHKAILTLCCSICIPVSGPRRSGLEVAFAETDPPAATGTRQVNLSVMAS